MSHESLRELYQRHRKQVWLIARYGIVGVLSILIQVAFLYIWVSLWGLQDAYLGGVALGFTIAFTTAFFLQKYWTFKDMDEKKRARQFFFYGIFALISLVLNSVVLSLVKSAFEGAGADFFKTWYLLVQVAILGTISILNFIANRFITFRKSV